MKLLVTGAGGFLGAAVVRAAAAAGLDVVATARTAEPPRLAGVADIARASLDLTDTAAMRALLAAERPSVIVHSAWSGLGGAARASARQITDNVLPTCALIEAAADAGVANFVGIGSQAEYGPREGRTHEHALPAPASMYGAAKLAALYLSQDLARQAGMGFAWLRLFATYGPGDNPAWLIPSLIAQLRMGERPRTTPGTQRWDYLYIDDAAQGVLAAARAPDPVGVCNLASGEPTPVRAIVERLRDLAAPGLELKFGEIPFAPGQIMHMEGAPDRLTRLTGWKPRIGLADGLRRTVDAARAEPECRAA